MSLMRKPRKENKIAKHMDRLKNQVLSRWRDEVLRDPGQRILMQALDDQELEDHLPALTHKVIQVLRGETAADLDEDAAEHGRQRRALGFSVVALVREMQ